MNRLAPLWPLLFWPAWPLDCALWRRGRRWCALSARACLLLHCHRLLITDDAQVFTGFGYYDVSLSDAICCAQSMRSCICSCANCAAGDHRQLPLQDSGLRCTRCVSCVLQVRHWPACMHMHMIFIGCTPEGSTMQAGSWGCLPSLHQQRLWDGHSNPLCGRHPMVS